MTPTKAIQGRAYGACPIQHTPAAECVVCDVIAEEMQAAVEAERERIKGQCPHCGGIGGIPVDVVVPVMNPDDPYGDPLPQVDQELQECEGCGWIRLDDD